jgi:hypothetical protein
MMSSARRIKKVCVLPQNIEDLKKPPLVHSAALKIVAS